MNCHQFLESHELCDQRQAKSFAKSVLQPLMIIFTIFSFYGISSVLIKDYWNWCRANSGECESISKVFKGQSVTGRLKKLMDHWIYIWSSSVPGKMIYYFWIASLRIPWAQPLSSGNFRKLLNHCIFSSGYFDSLFLCFHHSLYDYCLCRHVWPSLKFASVISATYCSL